MCNQSKKNCLSPNRAKRAVRILLEQFHTQVEKYSHFEKKLKDSGVVKVPAILLNPKYNKGVLVPLRNKRPSF